VTFPRRIAHAAWALARAVVTLLAFVFALALGLLLHLGLPSERRIVVRGLNLALASSFMGTVTVEQIDGLSIFGVRGVRLHVDGPDGSRLLSARGIRATVSPFRAARSALFGKGPLAIEVAVASVDDVEVDLDTDARGDLKLSHAFDPRMPNPGPSASGRGLRLSFPRVALGHAWVHGVLSGAPPIDAELSALKGALLVAPDVTKIDLTRADLLTRALPEDANVDGRVEAHASIPSGDSDAVLALDFGGAIGGLPTAASGTLVGKRVDAVVDVPEVAPERIRALRVDAPVYQAVFAHAEAHGELTELRANALFGIGQGRVALDARVSVGDDTSAHAHLVATDIDSRAFTSGGAHTRVGAVLDLQAEKPKLGPMTAALTLDVARGAYGDQAVPHALFRGEGSWNADATAGPVGVAGRVSGRIDEEGAPLTVEAELTPTGAGEQIVFDVRGDARRLDRVERLADPVRGRAEVEANGKVVLSSPPTLDVALHARLDDVSRGHERIRSANLKVLAKGPVSSPALTVLLDAEGVQVEGYRLSRVGVATNGLLDHQDVMLMVQGDEDFPTVEGRAGVEWKNGVRVQAVRLGVSRGDAAVELRVGEVAIGREEIRVRDATLDGLGELAHADLRQRGGELVVKASSAGLDLKRLGYVLRMEKTIRDGRLAFDVDLDARSDGAEGHAMIKAHHVCVSSIDQGQAEIDVRLSGREGSGAIGIVVGDVATLDVHSESIHVGGRGPLDLGAWKKAWGKVIFSGKADVGKVAAMLPADRLPVAQVSGKLWLEGDLARDSETDDTPEVVLSARTQGLVLATKGGEVTRSGAVEVVAPPKAKTAGIDAQVDLRVDGTTGSAEAAARLVDAKGAIVGLDAKSVEIPYKELFASTDDLGERLLRVPLSLTVAIPARKLEELPGWLKIPGGGGGIDGSLTLTGTADDPKVVASMHARSLRVGGMNQGTHLDGDLVFTYDGTRGDMDIHLRSLDREVLSANAHVDAKVKGVLTGKADIGAWTASAKGTLERFPLAAVSSLSDRQIGGHLSGDFSLDDLHKDARAKAALKVDDLAVGAASFKSGYVNVTLNGTALEADVRLDQDAGFAELKTKVGMNWGNQIAPAVDRKGAAEASLVARKFRAVTALPFLQSQLSELDGDIDADAHFAVSEGAKPTMQGNVKWTNGLLQVNALGEEFHSVTANVSLSPDGGVKLENASLAGPSGRVRIDGNAQFNGLALRSAEASIKIDKRTSVPIDLSGVSLGQVYGNIEVKAEGSPDGKTTTLNVDIPSLHVALPLTSASSVQDLGVPKDEHIGYFIATNRFQVLPMDGEEVPVQPSEQPSSSVTDIKVHLGNDVEIVRGTTLKVRLTGDPRLQIADKVVMRGAIRLTSGSLNVQGKKFEIEKGTVSFVGHDPQDPDVSVSAGWTAEDGTRVYADFIGPLKTGKVTLRSEPPRPRNEIVALILFGTADGSQSTPYASPAENNATRVGTTAGGFATEGLSKGLGQLSGMDVTTKIDTSESANPRPEVEVQIAKDISVQLAYVIGTPPPGMNPDTLYATIDWRFVRNWSLETTFGNYGSTMANFIWQYRY
jgi:translocation and assembly module TamB